MPLRLDATSDDFERGFSAFLASKRDSEADVSRVVADIIADVRARGDAALFELTRKFDKLDLDHTPIQVSETEIDQAEAQCAGELLRALDLAAARIADFHGRQIPQGLDYTDEAGIRLGFRWRPVSAAGLYVPGGRAAYPSSVLMNALPAKAAGVKRLVMTVPAPDGLLNPLVLAAARRAGVDTIYRVGGAQAVAALAHGTESIAPVDVIVGPGNAYVAEAKRQVYGTVGIDMVAGPSEILVVADGDNDPRWIAMDLMSQAEHDPVAQSILITDDAGFADRVDAAVSELLGELPRANIAGASWNQFGAIITVDNLTAAVALVDRIAPEHLELAVAEPEPLAEAINNAGAIFLGRWTPEAVGDYVAGPNHVLPTSGSARFASGLSVFDFLKRTTFMQCDAQSLQSVGPAVVALGEAEGLDAHARSVALRLDHLATGST